MRKTLYKAAALCLAVGLAFSSPGAAFVQAAAVETRQETEDILEGVETKFYENIYDDDGDGVNETGELSYICPEQTFDSYEDAVKALGEYVKQFCRLRQDDVRYFAVSVPVEFSSEEEIEELKKTQGRSMGQDVYNEVIKVTTDPDEGEMLAEECPLKSGFLNQMKYRNGKYTGNFVYRTLYRHTNDEYKAFQDKAKEVLDGLALSGKTDAEKVNEISKWIIKNVEYLGSSDVSEDESTIDIRSAYRALMNGSANCVGYSRLFQYLTISDGLDCYTIRGHMLYHNDIIELVNGGFYNEETNSFDKSALPANSSHAWNLIRVNGLYYYIDPQDGILFGTDGTKGFTIYNNKKYPHHIPSASTIKINENLISKDDYNTSNLSCTHQNTELRGAKEATCKEEGYTGNTYCLDCQNVAAAGTVIPKTDHTFDEGVITKAATCTEEGTKTFTCTVCRETKEETIAATGHQRTEIRDKKEASCEEAGYTGDTYCLDCKTVIEQGESIPATGHQNTEVRDAKEATCEEDGYTGDTYCKDCKKKIASGKTIPSKGHSYDEGVVTTKPTCTKAGVKTYTCSVCQNTKTEEIPALEHSYDKGVVTKEATCTEEGEKKFTCSRCENTYTETIAIDPDNHTWGEHISYIWDGDSCVAERECVNDPSHKDQITLSVKVESKGATCTTAGEAVYTATGSFSDGTEAKDSKTVTVEKLDHDYVATVTEPTCDKDGYTTYTCSRCGDTYTADWVNALPHSFEPEFKIEEKKAILRCSVCGYAKKVDADIQTEVKKEATCAEEGILSYTASVEFEGKTYSKEGEQAIEKLPHTEATVKGYAPTCTKDGRTDGVKCSVCEEVLTKQEVIPATGHQNTEIRNARTATCQKEGYTGDTYCKDCGEKISSGTTIAKTAHTWDAGKVTKAATYDAEGTKTYTCTGCGTTRTESIPKLAKPDVKVQRIALSALSNKIAVKKKMKLTAEVFPANAANKRITWTSSNPKVATVDQNGVVKVKKKGNVVITATAASGARASYKIKGMKGVVKKVTVSGAKTVKAGKSLKLKVRTIATKGANSKIKWISSNESYAKVSASGKVKTTKAAKGKKVKITAMATDGSNKKATMTIKVK